MAKSKGMEKAGVDPSDEEILEKQAERRRKHEAKSKAAEVSKAVQTLQIIRSLVIVTKEGSDTSRFMEGVRFAFQGKVLQLDMDGNVHDDDSGPHDELELQRKMSKHRHDHGGHGLVAVELFGGNSQNDVDMPNFEDALVNMMMLQRRESRGWHRPGPERQEPALLFVSPETTVDLQPSTRPGSGDLGGAIGLAKSIMTLGSNQDLASIHDAHAASLYRKMT